MEGQGRWMDNNFIERLWKSVKREDIYLKSYPLMRETRRGLFEWYIGSGLEISVIFLALITLLTVV